MVGSRSMLGGRTAASAGGSEIVGGVLGAFALRAYGDPDREGSGCDDARAADDFEGHALLPLVGAIAGGEGDGDDFAAGEFDEEDDLVVGGVGHGQGILSGC